MKRSTLITVVACTIILLVFLAVLIFLVAYYSKRSGVDKDYYKGKPPYPQPECQKGPWEYRTPDYCKEDQCDYYAKWDFDPKTDIIEFLVAANQPPDRWLAIGFSADKHMERSDAVIGRLNVQAPGQRVVDGWLEEHKSPFPIREEPDIFDTRIWYENGFTKMSFKRKRPGSNTMGMGKTDVAFTDSKCYYFLFPVLGGWYTEDNIVQHVFRPKISPTRICIREKCKKEEYEPEPNGGVNDPRVQPTNFSPGREYSGFFTIHVKATADARRCAAIAATLPDVVKPINNYMTRNLKVMAGVGFGYDFYTNRLGQTTLDNFFFQERLGGPTGDMPATGGDIFIHAKSNKEGNLFVLVQDMLRKFDEADCIDRCEDIYTFQYTDSRDLSGFIDGTENPQEQADRYDVAVEKETGGSYVLAQRWVHKMDFILGLTHGAGKDIPLMERFVGRTLKESFELSNKDIESHVARMTGGIELERDSDTEIVRQSQPYGQLCNAEAGLFFIAYFAKVNQMEVMLDRMTGRHPDGLGDNIMQFSLPVTGTYFFFPSTDKLAMIRNWI